MTDMIDSEEISPEEIPEAEPPSRAIDPAFAYIILIVVTVIGLRSMAPDVRYTLIWSLMVIVAILALLVDQVALERPRVSNLLVGVAIGLIVGLPVLLIGGAALKTVSGNIFGESSETSIFQMLAFTMPLAETLFFRAALQSARGQLATSAAASLWTMILFFPQLDIRSFPLVVLIIGIFFVFTSFLYSYLRGRFSLLSSWSAQVTINLLLLFVSRFMVT